MPEGLLNMLKPPGMTSHDVVERVRRILRERQVGHTGTLDPAAAGVMVLMVGATTRLSGYLTAQPKVYRAEITFGAATETLDGEGAVIERADASGLTAEAVAAALVEMTGPLEMPPPLHSAVRLGGERLYTLARRGESIEVAARSVTIKRFELLDFTPGAPARALTEVECSSGTYVRSLAARAGELVGLPAYLSFLVRTRVGAQVIVNALTGSELEQAVVTGRLDEALIPPAEALGWPCLVADRQTAAALAHGVQVPAWGPVAVGAPLLVVLENGRILCIAEALGGSEGPLVQPRRVLIDRERF